MTASATYDAEAQHEIDALRKETVAKAREITDLIDERDRLREKLDEARSYASHLATTMAAHDGAIEDWRPLPDLIGLLTQIDNMAAGRRIRAEAAEAERDRLREDRDNYKTAANREFGYRKELERQLRELDLSYKESEQDSTLSVKGQKCICGRPLFDGHSHDELAYGKEKL